MYGVSNVQIMIILFFYIDNDSEAMGHVISTFKKNEKCLFFKTLFWVSIANISNNGRQNPEIYKIVDNILVRIVIFIIEWWHEGVISNHVLFNSNFKTFNQVLQGVYKVIEVLESNLK